MFVSKEEFAFLIEECKQKNRFSNKVNSSIITPDGRVLKAPTGIDRQPKDYKDGKGRWNIYVDDPWGNRTWKTFSDEEFGNCYIASYQAAIDYILKNNNKVLLSGYSINSVELSNKKESTSIPGVILKTLTDRKSGKQYYFFVVGCGDLPKERIIVGYSDNKETKNFQNKLLSAIKKRKRMEQAYFKKYQFKKEMNDGVCHCKVCR